MTVIWYQCPYWYKQANLDNFEIWTIFWETYIIYLDVFIKTIQNLDVDSIKL